MNRLPSSLIAAALALWLWQQQWHWLIPFLIAPILLHSKIQFRWQLKDSDIFRLVDSCSLMMVGIAIYSIITLSTVEIVLNIIRFMPCVLYPVIVVSYYSNYAKIPLTALSMKARKKRRANQQIALDFPFVLSCILAGGISREQPELFFLAQTMLLLAVILFYSRPSFSWRRNVLYGAILVLLLGAGMFMHQRLIKLQHYVEQNAPEWLMSFFYNQHDPFKQSTALGQVGELKLSDDIIMRVKPLPADTKPQAPLLLQKSVFDQFDGHNWYTQYKVFFDVIAQNAQNWVLYKESNAIEQHKIEIQYEPDYQNTILPIMLGTTQIEQLQALELSRTQLGTLKASDVAERLSYIVHYTSQQSYDAAQQTDMIVPTQLQPALQQVLSEFPETVRGNAAVFLAQLQRYFLQNFRYSLLLENRAEQPLAEFLLHNRNGHCEYFASATVLLLRANGIPARYVSGYSVQEYSELEQVYRVRALHAHAWAIAFINGKWQTVDFTPPDWSSVDNNAFNQGWRSFKDLFSWLFFELSQLTQGKRLGLSDRYWLLIAGLGILYLVRRLHMRKWKSGQSSHKTQWQTPQFQPTASPAEAVYHYLKKLSVDPSQTFKQLVQSLSLQDDAMLQEIAQQHYRCLYDPAQVTSKERQALQQLCEQWLSQQQTLSKTTSN